MKKINFILLILQLAVTVVILSCTGDKKQIKFDRGKWARQTDPLFPSAYRSQMLADLTTNYKLKGLKYSELTELLGIPDSMNGNSLSYKISVDYKGDVDPVYTKDLNFYFSNDSVITSLKIKEWRKQEIR